MQNSGETPAFHSRATVVWYSLPGKNSPLPANFSFPIPANALKIGNVDIGKDKEKGLNGKIDEEEFPKFRDAISGEKTLYIYGFVEYCDIYDKAHTTAFCFRYESSMTDYPFCDRHNGEIEPAHQCEHFKL